MSKYLTAGILISLMLIQACNRPSGLPSQGTERLTAWVDPFIGTGFHGYTFPGAAYPFGQVQVSPDNGTQGWDWCSGYHYSDSVIAGFSHLHLSGTGIGDLCDISFLPLNCEPEIRKGESNRDFLKRYSAKFSHANEYAEPGYYSVRLGNDIKVEITVTERAGFQKYVFPGEGPKNLLINLGFAINWDKPYKTEISLADSFTVTGVRLSQGWAEDQHVFFATRFSEPVKSWSVTEIGGKARSAGIFRFEAKELLVKTALSSVSIENAIANLESSAPGWDFGAVKAAASDAWEKELSKITIKSPDNDQKKIFYSALYHTMIAPALFSDENGEFKGVKGDVQKAEGYKRYTVFSLWDTYRALHPLFTIIQGERVNDMVKSMLDHYRQSGLLPVWELEGNETFCMVGNHAISVIAEAVMKEIGDFDREEAFQAIKASSLYDRDGMRLYDSLGYIPADIIRQSVAKQLEIAVDDRAVALVAEKLRKHEDAIYFYKRSQSYSQLFDPGTGFFRGKNLSGEWTTPFDPLYSKHEGSDYTEGNAWQYLWLVPHDVEGLTELLGGKEKFADKLDQMFALSEGVRGEEASADITGLIGAYAHGNEPGHHTTFLFNYADRPWRTQELNRIIQTTMYKNSPDGLIGNEDCGQMSAWYILSAMGFYPVFPPDMKYQLGSPIVREAVITVGPGKYFIVKAPGASVENKYVKRVRLNGKVLDRTYITHDEIMEGGLLEFTMGRSR